VKNIYKKNGRKRVHENMESFLPLGERVLQLSESDHTWKKNVLCLEERVLFRSMLWWNGFFFIQKPFFDRSESVLSRSKN
jgi:hypothetical protein